LEPVRIKTNEEPNRNKKQRDEKRQKERGRWTLSISIARCVALSCSFHSRELSPSLFLGARRGEKILILT